MTNQEQPPKEDKNEVVLPEKVEATPDPKIEEEKQRQAEKIHEELGEIGLDEDDFAEIPKWAELSHGEKLLVIEQASQDILGKVKETGERNFQEKNKINYSINPTKWSIDAGKKLWHKFGKSYWISKEEKQVIEDVKSGNIKPEKGILEALVKRTADMELNVVEKDGFASIEFISIDKDASPEERKALEEYNELANQFAQMPDAWKNERAAKSTDGTVGKNKNYEEYKTTKESYQKTVGSVLKYKKDAYIKSGMSESEAQEKAMLDLKDSEYNIAILQLTNTNPDALAELDRIENEASYKRLFNNENVWRGVYMAGGFVTRTATKATLGVLAAPLVSGIVGGFRGHRKAKEKIDASFAEGRKEQTFLERKEAGKQGAFEDKSGGALASVMPGVAKVNAKEMASFVDADSQLNRLNTLMEKFENSTDAKERSMLISQLTARINYIGDKHEKGLINYGTKDSIALGYNLLKTLSEAEVTATMHPLGVAGLNDLTDPEKVEKLEPEFLSNLADDSAEKNSRRADLLKRIIKSNENKQESEQGKFIKKEIAKGVATGAVFSLIGMGIKEGWSEITTSSEATVGAIGGGTTTEGETGTSGFKINVEEVGKGGTIAPHANIEAIANNGQGAISTIEELQGKLEVEYGTDLEHAPAGVKHIMETPAIKLAEEYGMYKPDQVEESAMMLKGAKLSIDQNGNLNFTQGGQTESVVLGGNASKNYDGKMFDSDGKPKLNTEHAGDLNKNIGGGLPKESVTDLSKIQTTPDIIDDNTPIEFENGQTIPAGLEGGSVELSTGQTVPDGLIEDNTLEQAQVAPSIATEIKTPANSPLANNFNTNTQAPFLMTPDGVKVWDASKGAYVAAANISQAFDATHPNQLPTMNSTQELPTMNGNKELPTSNGKGQLPTMGRTTPEVAQTPNTGSAGAEANKGINIDRDVKHFENAKEVKHFYGRKNVTLDRPDHEKINGIKNINWNRATDEVFKTKNVELHSEDEYEKEDTMQRLLGEAKQEARYNPVTDKNQQVITMNYFREQPEWKSGVVSKIPAKYFFNVGKPEDIVLTDGNKISADQLQQLKSTGVIREVTSGKYEFKNVEELKRISSTYERYTPSKEKYLHNEAPIGDEPLEKYVTRMTRVVHSTDNGTLYAVDNKGAVDTVDVRTKPAGVNDQSISGANNNLPSNTTTTTATDDYQKVFPSSEQVQGIPRAEFDSKVEKILDRTWQDEASRKTDLWMWEKFGKVDGTNTQAPDQNTELVEAVRNSATVSDLMKNTNVGKELVELQNKVESTTGTRVEPTDDESVTQYITRLMEKLVK